MPESLIARESLVRVPCPVCGADRPRHERDIRGYNLDRCGGCKMVYVNPQLPPRGLTEMYEDRGDDEAMIAWYARVTDAAKLAEFDEILDRIEKALPGRGRILDFGCGPGYFVERAARRGWEAHGVELGTWAAEAARRRGLPNFHHGALADQQFPDGWFDVVTAQQVLEHLSNPKADLAEIRRVLRPGGIFYANVPNYRCLSIVLGRDDFELNWPMDHVNYFSPSSLRRLLEACGFRVLRTSTFGGLKWENLLGRPISSAESKARRGELNGHPAAPTLVGANTVVRPSLPKRVLFPALKKVLYEWAKVGINLEAICCNM